VAGQPELRLEGYPHHTGEPVDVFGSLNQLMLERDDARLDNY
jgi:hypothetical protein